MENQPQSPAELIRLVIAGEIPEIEVCNLIENWASDPKVGGFINLADTPAEIQEAWRSACGDILPSWPEDLTMPTDESLEEHKTAVKAFRKLAKKSHKASKERNPRNYIALPFAKMAYNAGTVLVEDGFCQWHVSIVINEVKLGVHFWAVPNGDSFAFPHEGKFLFTKFKIDKEEQLALFV